jgi:hypothetical protein
VDDGQIAETDFRRQRSAGVVFIAIGMIAAVALWFGLKCWCLAVLFCLVTGVEAVAHERLVSPAFDPLADFQTRRLRVNQRYLQNTVEQVIVLAAALFGLTTYCPSGSAMRAVVATTAVWITARFAFWIGYHQSAAMRGLGAPGMALSMVVLVYVASRFGYDLAGPIGGAAPVAAFLAIEAVLFWATRPLPR